MLGFQSRAYHACMYMHDLETRQNMRKQPERADFECFRIEGARSAEQSAASEQRVARSIRGIGAEGSAEQSSALRQIKINKEEFRWKKKLQLNLKMCPRFIS